MVHAHHPLSFLQDGLQELSDAVEPRVATCSRRSFSLEAMVAGGQGVKFTLYSHAAHLLPSLHRVHGGIAIGISVDEQHGSSPEVEVELWHQRCVVGITTAGVLPVRTIRQDVRRIDTNPPLNVARLLVDIVDGQIGLLHGRSDTHQRQVTSCRATHNANLLGVKSQALGLAAYDAYGALHVLPRGGVLGQTTLGGGSWRAVFHGDDRHSEFVEVAASWRHLETIGIIAVVRTTRVDNLDGLRLQLLREMTF